MSTWVTIGLGNDAQEGSPLRTNLDLIRVLAGEIATRVVDESKIPGGERVQIVIQPRESSWFVDGAVVEAVQKAQLTVMDNASARFLIEFGFDKASVEYENIRRNGLFGGKYVDRLVRLRLTAKAVDRQTGLLLLSSDFEKTLVDTIELSAISQVENNEVSMTKGTLPREGFFSNFAEPLIIIGSIAVAVTLLFTVRS